MQQEREAEEDRGDELDGNVEIGAVEPEGEGLAEQANQEAEQQGPPTTGGAQARKGQQRQGKCAGQHDISTQVKFQLKE
jgi:hypothetical protein